MNDLILAAKDFISANEHLKEFERLNPDTCGGEWDVLFSKKDAAYEKMKELCNDTN